MTPALGRPDTRLRKIEESGGLGLDASPTVELEKPSEMFWGGGPTMTPSIVSLINLMKVPANYARNSLS